MSAPLPDVPARVRRRSQPLLLLCLALLPLLGAAEALGWRAAFGPPSAPAQADTTVLFGPKQFNATNAGALYVEQFSTTVDHAATYLLEVTNGTASNTNRVVNGAVKLNGTTIVPAATLQSGGRVITRAVWPANGTNTLQVEAKGNAALHMNVRLLRIVPQARPLYRHGWRKTAAAYQVFHDTFATPRGVSMPGRLYVEQGSSADSVFLNGQRIHPSCVPDMNTSCTTSVDLFHDVSLQGVNAIRVEMGGPAGSAVVVRVEAVDTMAPVIAVTSPAQPFVTKDGTLTVAGTVTDDTPPVTFTINGDTVPVNGTTGAFSHSVALAHDGTHTIELVARDGATAAGGEIVISPDPMEPGPQGNVAQVVRTVIRDSQAPALALAAPADGAVVDAATVLVQGTATDATALTVNVNGVPVAPDASGAFALEVALAEGANFVTATATDAAGNASTVTRQVTRSAPPVLAVSAPVDGSVTQAAAVDVQGTATGAAPLSLTLNGSPVALGTDGSFSQSVPLAVGANALSLVLTDGAGRTATATRSVTREQDVELPPDPATVAPALERGVATGFAAANAFLYTGDDPIQTGVAPGTIEPRRVGVLRGRVLTREGAPLPGVRVSVLGHPELGQTLSRADGMFDLAANGGGELVLHYEKAGVLPAQRPVRVDWQRFTHVDDVRLVTLDTAVTVVDFSQPAQVARGSVAVDADGPRQATLVFRQGTVASLEMPDGTLVPAPSLSVRATEYTVGPDGREAMPGPLPPTVAYTYAVELSADEAIAAGAAHVRFDRPVSVYVDNFLGFPAGTPVPAAYFDYARGLWVPQDDGRVVSVLSVDGGMATVDVNGDGVAEGPDALAAWGFDAAELTRLATLYAPGTTLWRVQATHFSPWDLNYPAGPGPGPAPDPPPPGPDPDDGEEGICEGRESGSIIECQTRVLGESVALLGTPYNLAYRSNRVPGRAGGRRVSVRLTDGQPPANLHSVRVEVEIAGRRFTQLYSQPGPNLMHEMEWDGMDAYGRPVQGRQMARVRRTYRYPMRYLLPTADTARIRSFGMVCQGVESPLWLACTVGADPPEEISRFFAERSDVQDYVQQVDASPPTSSWDARRLGLGGWTLDVHHAYDPGGRTLYLGDGTTVPATPRNGEIRNVAGRRDSCPRAEEPVCGDGGPATEAWLDWVDGMAFGPDGSLYLGDWAARKMRVLRPSGVLETFAGTGVLGFSGMDGPATDAQIGSPMDADVGPDGSVYIADAYYSRVYRVTPAGIIHVVAGSGDWDGSTDSGDEGPATAAPMDPVAVAAGPDGSVYIVDNDNHRVRRVGPDGTIHTVAGTGTCGETGDGGPATLARLCYPNDITFGPDGSLYISDSPLIRRVTPDGIITTVAGFTGSPDCYILFYDFDDPSCGEGKPATQVPMYGAGDLDVGPDGSLYFAHRGIDVVRRIATDGTVETLAGISTFMPGIWCNSWGGAISGDPECGNGAGARQVEMGPSSVLVGPDGKLYVNDYSNNLIRRVGPALEGYSQDRFYIPSGSGEQLFVFDAAGRHLETHDALTGVRQLLFSYDAGGLLSGVTDVDGRQTVIQRGADGTPLAVVGPYGERTTLALNADGWLSGVTDPAGRSLGLGYRGEGLLSSVTDPRGETTLFDYEGAGYLWRDRDPAGGFKQLDRFTEVCRTSSGQVLYGTSVTTPSDPVVSCTRGSGVRVTTAEGRRTLHWAYQQEGGTVRETVGPEGTVARTEELVTGGTLSRQADGTTMAMSARRDPRWGMQAPGLDSLRVTLPSGLTSHTRTARRVTLADPDNSLSLLSRTDSIVVNGRVFTDVYDATLRQRTLLTPEGRASVSRLDSLGRLVEQVEPGQAATQGVYDGLGRLQQFTQGSRSWTYGYDGSGRLASVTDPLQRVSGFDYDSAGRIVTQRLPDGRALHYTYDAKGNLTSVAPPGRTAHVFEYSSVGLAERYTPPAAAGSGAMLYRYNLDRDLVQVIRPDSQVLDLDYDGGGRLSTITMPGRQLQYGYDPATGLLQTITASDSSALAYTYDGTLPLSVQWTGTVAGRVDATWNENFWMTSQSVNGGHAVSFAYDGDGLLTDVGDLQLARSAQTGMLTGSTLGEVTQSLGYNPYGELAADTVRGGGAVLLARSYTRDAVGRIATLTETAAGATSLYAFDYDSIGRLTQVTRDGVAVESYEWDANGNRTRAVTAAGVAEGTVDAQDRLLTYGGATYAYTAAGELETRVIGADTTRYRYDLSGGLREVRLPDGTVLEYLVDPHDRRVGRRVNGVLDKGFLYQGALSPVAELDGAGNVVSRFVYGTRGNVPEYMVKGGDTYRLVTDHLGSVRLVVNAADGQIAQRMDYDSWGNVILDSNPGFQPFGFAGGLYEAQTGLTRFGARDYEARTGRWTARDPILFNGGSNLYAYALEDPVNAVDPDGLQPSAPPPPNVPGGPWTWYPNPTGNDRMGEYRDPAGNRTSWDPEGHWDWNAGGQAGNRQRYDRWGNPITKQQAHGYQGPHQKEPINFEKRQKGPRGGGRGLRGLNGLGMLFDLLWIYCAEQRSKEYGTSPWYEMLLDMGAVPPPPPMA